MAFKKRIKSRVIDNTQVNVTSEYGRKKDKKKSCSIVVNGLLMASMLLSMTIPTKDVNAMGIDSVEGKNEQIENQSGVQYDSQSELESLGVVDESNVDVNTNFDSRSSVSEFKQQQSERASVRAAKEVKLAGTNRYKTAVSISKAGWTTASKALLVNGTALPDALCASPLADEYDAPILLTETDKLNEDTLAELKRLGVKQVTLIGSEGVISASQETQLKQQGFQVERIGGLNRYETSINVANKLQSLYKAKGTTGRKIAFLANGVKGLADATSVSSPAGIKDAVILYTNGSNLAGVKSYITSYTDEVYLIGGTSVISQGVENELKTTTNKKIVRLAGSNRKDTNAKVVDKFFPNKDTSKVYVAKDGMGAENHLVDGLAVGSLASKNNSPVILASDNLSENQKSTLKGRTVGEVVQVGEGKNANPAKQTIGIINAIAQPEAEDGMKLPTIQFAPEKSMVMSGYGGYNQPSWNKIEGKITVKYGNEKTRPHSYGSKNQSEYDYVVNFVKNKLKTINFRLKSDWVYLQHFIKNGNKNLDDNYVDPILAKNGIDVRYKTWKNNNNYLIIGLQKGIVSREDAEKLCMYNSAVSHVVNGLKTTDPGDGSPYSAYNYFFEGLADCDSYGVGLSLIGDVLGLNTMVGGSEGHQEVMIRVGNYWWNDGRKPTLNATDNVFQKLPVVYEAPTY